ncbi:hypothetical protein FOL47_009619 [Perkinsus chesapeaki]|uniref:Major facilitator superfamily (MFS) profile domain-containing protein n=1 Tax=Perkinsus chesapeaki TaxID=330153 RepID=A0A7J6L7B1_PERCH|nr:hypothetical protein FOL47_009619 [Perkinsus chesapeaki]
MLIRSPWIPAEEADGLRRRNGLCYGTLARYLIDLVIVYSSVIMDFMGYTLLAPLFPTIVADLGTGGFPDGFAASWLMAMYGLGQFISAMVMGTVSDMAGRRPVFVFAFALTTVVYVAQGLADSYWMFAITRFCAGLTTGTRPVAFSYLGDITTPEKMAVYSMLVGVMIAVGSLMPLLGGTLGTISWRLPVFVSAGFTFCLAVLAVLFLRESKRAQVMETGDVRGQKSGIMRTPLFIVTLSMIAITGAGVQFGNISVVTILPWLLKEVYQMSLSSIGLVLGCQAIPTLLTLLLVFLPLSRRIPMPIIAFLGMLGHATMFALPLMDNRSAVIFTSYLLCFGNSMVYSSVPVMAKVIAPPPRRGLVNGIVLGAMLLAGALGPLIAGLLWPVDTDHIMAFAVVSAVACLGAICMLFAWRLIPAVVLRMTEQLEREDLTEKQVDDLYDELAELVGTRDYRRKLAAQIRRRRQIALEEGAPTLEALRIMKKMSFSEISAERFGGTEEEIAQLGRDVSQILNRNNWYRWPVYYEWILAQIASAFPPIREAPEDTRFEDVTWVMERQLEIVSQWERNKLSKFRKGNLQGM